MGRTSRTSPSTVGTGPLGSWARDRSRRSSRSCQGLPGLSTWSSPSARKVRSSGDRTVIVWIVGMLTVGSGPSASVPDSGWSTPTCSELLSSWPPSTPASPSETSRLPLDTLIQGPRQSMTEGGRTSTVMPRTSLWPSSPAGSSQLLPAPTNTFASASASNLSGSITRSPAGVRGHLSQVHIELRRSGQEDDRRMIVDEYPPPGHCHSPEYEVPSGAKQPTKKLSESVPPNQMRSVSPSISQVYVKLAPWMSM